MAARRPLPLRSQGGASGNANSTITLTDSHPFNELIQRFTPGNSPGSQLSFLLNTTNNVDTAVGASPDELSFYILGNLGEGGYPVPTTDPSGADSLVTVDLTGGASPTISVYQGAGANYEALTATVTPTFSPNASPAPEPASWAMAGMVCLGLGGMLLRARKRAQA